METFDLVARWVFIWLLCGVVTLPFWWLHNRDFLRITDGGVAAGWAAFLVPVWPMFWGALLYDKAIEPCARQVFNTYFCVKFAYLGPDSDADAWRAAWRFHPKRMRLLARLFRRAADPPPRRAR